MEEANSKLQATESRTENVAAAPEEPPVLPRAALVRTEGLTRYYDGKPAVVDLDLTVAEGEVFGFIGPNGAGKTTTLRILAALLRPTRGRAEVCGYDVVRSPLAVKEVVGFMPDGFGVYENMTLREYLEFFAAVYRVPRPKRRQVIDDVLELTDLAPKADEFVSAFSRGMKQRACLAKTLVHDPKLLLLDEPASGLDPRARVEFRELLQELQRMGKTIVVSSHILRELAAVCTSVGIIEAGKLVASGPVRDILARVQAHREFVLELLDPNEGERAAAVLKELPQIKEVETRGNALHMRLDATDPEVATVPEVLVAHGIRFVTFREELVDLEAAFLTLTRGELA